jgi:hypothetical protein
MVLTSIWFGNDDTVSIIAHNIFHVLNCIACPSGEDDVLKLNRMKGFEVLIEEGR